MPNEGDVLRPNDPNSGHDTGETTDWPVTGASPAERGPAPSAQGPAGEDATQEVGRFTRPPQQPPAAPPAASGWSLHDESTQEAAQFPRPSQQPPAASSGWPQAPDPAHLHPAQGHAPASQQYGAPAGGYPPPTYPVYPSPLPTTPKGKSALADRRWWAVGGAVVLVAAIGGVAFMVNRGGTDTAAGGPTPTTTAAQVPAVPVTTMQTEPSQPAVPPSATPAPPSPIVAADALPGLLLSPDQISQRLNAPGINPIDLVHTVLPGTTTPANCGGAFSPADGSSYNGSGFTGVAVQGLSTDTVRVLQSVAAFPDPGGAKAFFDKQSADWSSCQSTHVTWSYQGQSTEVDLGVPAMAGDVMTLGSTSINKTGANKRCERALTPRGNVIVDVRVCSPDINSGGYGIASDIAAKIR